MTPARKPTSSRTALLVRRTATVASVLTVAAGVPLAPGGSNFSWYRVDRPQPGVCIREPYGVIPGFGDPAVQATARGELAQMIASGQRRLRIGIFFARGIDSGTVMDSTGGDLSAQNRRNLVGLLAAVRAAGFAEVEVAFHPEGRNRPADWTRWDEGLFQEHRRLIGNLRPLIRASGLPYRIDLANEVVPAPHQPLLLRYARRLWASYTRAFGRRDTVGFSVIGDPARAARIRQVYGAAPPPIFDVHFYPSAQADERTLFARTDATMRHAGLTQPWIIGEALYDDAIAAGGLREAIAGTRRPVYYLTQWPLTRGSACADVDVAAPTAYDAYLAAGFGGPPGGPPAPLPILRTRTLVVGGGGWAALHVGCANTAAQCSGTVALRVEGRALRARRFSLLPPETVVRRVRLPGAARAGLRRRGRLRATVALSARSDGGATIARRTLRILIVHGGPAASRP